ncbi:hypothetical protein R6Q59_009860 [Mikania micrantha]
MPTSQDTNLTNAAKFTTSILGNTVGGLTRTVGNVTGAASRGVGDTVTAATGNLGRPIGDVVACAVSLTRSVYLVVLCSVLSWLRPEAPFQFCPGLQRCHRSFLSPAARPPASAARSEMSDEKLQDDNAPLSSKGSKLIRMATVDMNPYFAASSKKTKRLPEWLDHFNARDLKILFKCSMAAWIYTLFLLLEPTLKVIGQATFFGV